MGRKLIIVGVFLAAAAACSKDRAREKPPQPPGASVLDHVPADSPYVITGIAPLPKEYSEALDVTVRSYVDMIRGMAAAIGWSNTDKIAVAAIEELEEGGFGALGLDEANEWAIYGLGVFPHIRVRLEDPDTITTFVDNVEKRAGAKLPRKKFRGVEYVAFEIEGGLTFAVGLHETDLVGALYAREHQEAALEHMFGVTRPRKALGRTAAEQFAKQHGYHESWIGWIDLPTGLRLAFDRGRNLTGAKFTAKALGDLGLSDACERELIELAEHFPRYEFGYSELSRTRRVGGAVWRLSPRLGAALDAIFTATPGYSAARDATPLFAVGAGIDGAAVADQLGRLGATPFECADIAAVTSLLPGVQELGPVLGEFGGFYAVVQSMGRGTTMDLLPSITGYAVLKHGDPHALLTLAGPLLGVPIDATSGPVELDVAEELVLVERLRVEVRGDLILMSTGTGGRELLASALASPADDPPDLVFMYDEKRLLTDSKPWPILRESLSDTTPEYHDLEEAAAVGFSEILMSFDDQLITFHIDEQL